MDNSYESRGSGPAEFPTYVAGPTPPTPPPWPPTTLAPPPAPPPAPPTPPPTARPSSGRVRRAGGAAAIALIALGAGYAGGRLGDSTDNTVAATSNPLGAQVRTASVKGQTLDVATILDTVEPSVVSIETVVSVTNGRFRSQGTGAGTGIVLSADGYIITNAHVVEGATSITVTVSGDSAPRTATLVAADAAHDIAVLKLANTNGLVAAPLGSSDELRVGDTVLAIGNALALEGGLSVTQGIVSALDRSIDTATGSLSHLVQTDAAISSGNSGGALVNAYGKVVGINTAVAASSSGVTASNIGFAISINDAAALAEQLIAANT